MDSSKPLTQRRRSERISDSLPLVVRGIDLLGQPFEERTSTLNFNLHGCRYVSKHHLPKNTWVTLELARDAQHRNLRARVAWIQRPHSVREFFQIAVELESPANVWGLDLLPGDWAPPDAISHDLTASDLKLHDATSDAPAPQILPPVGAEETAKPRAERSPITLASILGRQATDPSPAAAESSAASQPLLRELRTELKHQAAEAAETLENISVQARDELRRIYEELNRSREAAAADLAMLREEFIGGVRSELASKFSHVQELIPEIGRSIEDLRAENQAAIEAAGRLAQTRLQIEAAAIAAPHSAVAPVADASATVEGNSASYRERLDSEMARAAEQWTELLESSLDKGMKRLADQIVDRSQEALREAEQKFAVVLTELSQPLVNVSAEARRALPELRSAIEGEVCAARRELAEMERSAGEMKERLGQFEAMSQESFRDLQQRVESLLASRTDQMNRCAETIVADLPQRAAASLDALGAEFLERTVAQIESRLSPRMERVPELIRELDARQMQTEEGLRLHRERLRQMSDNSRNEMSARMAGSLAELRGQFEAVRAESLEKWGEEMEASGARASHAASESISRISDSLEHEARAKFGAFAEQSLAAANSSLDGKMAEAAAGFAERLATESLSQAAQARERMENLATDAVLRSRTQLEQAAEAAAASFGLVLHELSEGQSLQFAQASRGILTERAEELQLSASETLQNFEAGAGASLGRFHAEMSSRVENSMQQGRAALAAEFASALDSYRAERDSWRDDWTRSLDQLGNAATENYRNRLQADAESWVASSVRGLNEQGLDTIESLKISAEAALRDSCSRIFESLADAFRGRPGVTAAAIAGFVPPPGRDVPEAPLPHNEASSGQINA